MAPVRLRSLILLINLAVVSSLLCAVVAPTAAYAAGTVLFQNNFTNRTVDGTGTVTKPTSPSGTNLACLTATGNSATPPLLSCSGTLDAQGSGKLRLTAASANQIGGIFGATSFPTSSGLDVTFNSYQYGGSSADGMSFVLAAVDPANPAPQPRSGRAAARWATPPTAAWPVWPTPISGSGSTSTATTAALRSRAAAAPPTPTSTLKCPGPSSSAARATARRATAA